MSTPARKTYVTCDTAPLWTAYASNRSDANRNALVVAHMPFLEMLCARIAKQLPTFCDNEDLLSVAAIGLMQAIASFDPSRGVPFLVHAGNRVRGEMLDSLRRIDPVSRQVRDRIKLFDRIVESLTQDLCRPPAPEEVADQLAGLGHTAKLIRYRSPEIRSLGSIVHRLNNEAIELGSTLVDGRADNPFDIAARNEIVEESLRVLPPPAAMFITFYFFEGHTQTAIGRRIGLSESRMSQLMNKAIDQLARHFRKAA